MPRDFRRPAGWILRKARPISLYAAPLLISLNLSRLPKSVWLWPGHEDSRAFLMLWTALILLLAWLADRGLARRLLVNQSGSAPASTSPLPDSPSSVSPRGAATPASAVYGSDALFFLAWSVPGMLLLNLAGIAHLYLAWYHSGQSALPPSLPVLLLMAVGCVLWIYGRVLPRIPFGSIWGPRTKESLSSPEAWCTLSCRSAPVCLAAGALCLLVGTLMLV